MDPIASKFPELTPYQFGSDDPVENIDLDGLEGVPAKRQPNGTYSAAQSSTYVKPVQRPQIKVIPPVIVIEQTIAMADINGHGWIGPAQSYVLPNVAAVKQQYKDAVGDNIRGGLFGTVGYLAGGDKGSFVGATFDGVAMSFGGNGAPGVFPSGINKTNSFNVETTEWQPNREPELNLNIKIRPPGMSAMEWGNQLHYDKLAGGTGEGLPTQLQQLYPETQFEFTGRGVKGVDVKVVGGKKPWEYRSSTWTPGNLFGDFKTIGDTKFNGEIKSGKLPQNTQKLTYDPSTGQLQN